MGTCEDVRPDITLDKEISSGASDLGNGAHPHHDLVCKDGDGCIDAENHAVHANPAGGDQNHCSSPEQALTKKLENTHLVGEEVRVEVVEEERGEAEGANLVIEAGEENARVGDDIEGKGEGKIVNPSMEWDEKKDVEEEDRLDWQENGNGPFRFPLRPGAEDCSFYMKTGSCKFGFNCKFNHPENREKHEAYAEHGQEFELQGLSGDLGKIECKFYLSPSGCKYGDACRYSHSREKIDGDQTELNFLGLPLRPSAKECQFYMRNGSCGYGANCRFNHPDPTATIEDSKSALYNGLPSRDNTVISAGNSSQMVPMSAPRQVMAHSSSSENFPSQMPWVNPISQGVPPISGWNQYQMPLNMPNNTMSTQPNQVMTDSFKKTNSFGRQLEIPTGEEFPERPGVPECDYFMKTGTCKFRSQCRYHHPKSRLLQNAPNGLNHSVMKGPSVMLPHQHFQPQTVHEVEYPERPGEPECSFFMRNGDCKYKSQCRYHHPKNQIPKSTMPAAAPVMNGWSSGVAQTLPSEPKRPFQSYPNYLNQKPKSSFNCKQHQQPGRVVDEFPERPGEPECDYFMKTGNCKYGPNCRYHHPKGDTKGGVGGGVSASAVPKCELNEKGLPLRPGAKTCRNYEQLGICKYGPRCLFDHPAGYGLSVDSGGSIPISDHLHSPVPESPTNNNDDWGDGWV